MSFNCGVLTVREAVGSDLGNFLKVEIVLGVEVKEAIDGLCIWLEMFGQREKLKKK